MELYDKAYFAALKERIKALDKSPILFGLNYLVVSVIFFSVWSNFIFDIPFILLPYLIFIPTGLIIPFVLLYNIVKKNHSKSLLFVIVIMSSTFFLELFDLVYYYKMYLDDPLFWESDTCPICEIEDSVQFIIISFIAILLMINRPMATKFSLSRRNILLAIFLPSSLLFFKTIQFFIGSLL